MEPDDTKDMFLVQDWLTLLNLRLVQWDLRQPHQDTGDWRLGEILVKLTRVAKDVQRVIHLGDPDSLDKLKLSIKNRQLGNLQPTKKVLTQIDQYLENGAVPNYPTVRG
jgi:hypothetical protein